MGTLMISLVFAAVFFIMQLLFCSGARRKRVKMTPIWILLAAGLAVSLDGLTGLGSYDLGSVITMREAQCLAFSVFILGGAIGDALAWLAFRSTYWRTK